MCFTNSFFSPRYRFGRGGVDATANEMIVDVALAVYAYRFSGVVPICPSHGMQVTVQRRRRDLVIVMVVAGYTVPTRPTRYSTATRTHRHTWRDTESGTRQMSLDLERKPERSFDFQSNCPICGLKTSALSL